MGQISVRQNFRLNETDYYTIFDLPIMVTNSIEADDDRPSCESLTNELLTPEELDAVAANEVGILFAPDSSDEVDFEGATGKGPEEDPQNGDGGDESDDGDDEDDPALGGERPEAGPEDGLGGAGMVEISWAVLMAGALLGML